MTAGATSVIGLGKLGASMAAAIAGRGHDVVGVDSRQDVVDAINRGEAPVTETGLDGMIAANRERLRATTSFREAIACTDVTFVVVPTPSDRRGAYELGPAVAACRSIGGALAAKRDYHLVVVSSTVLPGATRAALMPVLERTSARRCGPDFGLCYSPEFIALGSVIRDFLEPDFVLVGESDGRAGDALEARLSGIVAEDVALRRTSLENAELAKLAVNAFVTTKIGFANMLADLCERIPGGDVDEVTGVLGLDRRIGPRALSGGLPFGGPCFPRDNAALAVLARRLGTAAPIPLATDRANRDWSESVVRRLRPLVRSGTAAAVLGLAYKPSSTVIERSPGIEIARALERFGARVTVHDTLAGAAAMTELGERVRLADSPRACVADADVVVLALPDPAFAGLGPEDLKAPVTVLDCWRSMEDRLAGSEHVRYLAVGRPEAPSPEPAPAPAPSPNGVPAPGPAREVRVAP